MSSAAAWKQDTDDNSLTQSAQKRQGGGIAGEDACKETP